jgi:1,4-dihydroxy-2-naphthoate octaprenyltransferase
VRFGVGFAKAEYVICLIIAFMLPLFLYILTSKNFYSVLTILIIIPALPGLRSVLDNKQGAVLNNVLSRTGKVLFLYSIVFSLGWNL